MAAYFKYFWKSFISVVIMLLFSGCPELIDIFPPELTILEPTGAEPVEPTFDVKLDVTDNDEVESVEIIIRNGETEIAQETLSAEPWETSLTVNDTGNVTLEAKATDAMGNFVNEELSFQIIEESGSSPTITVTSPNGGENWEPGSSHSITWSSSNLPGSYVAIQLYRSGSSSFISNSTIDDGNYTWSIPSSQTESDYYQVKIYSTTAPDIYDMSNNNFSIGDGSSGSSTITVTSPNGGENWEPGNSHSITWSSSNLPGSNVGIQLYRSGVYITSISSSTTDDGSYTWSISSSQTESDYYQVKIYSTSESSISDYSDNYFTIEETSSSGPTITVTSPNGGEDWEPGSSHSITWSSSNLPGSNVGIQLYRSGVYITSISSSTTDDGSYTWSISSSLAEHDDYQVMIYSTSESSISDYSDNYFTIESATPSITVTSPNGYEDWETGTSHSITWNSANLSGNYVGIQLYRSGSYVSSISSSTTDDGSYTWSISSSQTESDYYQVKIYSTSESSISDYSDDYFTIEEPTSSSCNTPTNLQTTNITTTSAVLDWGSVSGAISYNIMYRENGQSWDMTSDITSSGANWSGLSANTTYQWQVQSDCGSSTTSFWSSIISFTTPDDGGGGSNADCDNPHYCSDCDGCEGSCCPNYCSGFYYYYNRTCDGNGFCIGATSDYCPDGCNDNGCL
jgi:hypothetical protein